MSLFRSLQAMIGRSSRPAQFSLKYHQEKDLIVEVGTLTFDGSAWEFSYSGEYKTRSDLRPIEGFDEVDKVYRSTVLFPFFAVRVPDVERADVQRKLQMDHIKHPETADLLRIFGRRVVSSPAFELVPLSLPKTA